MKWEAPYHRNNFLALDIYYTELKYQLVEQQPAFSPSEFWGMYRL